MKYFFVHKLRYFLIVISIFPIWPTAMTFAADTKELVFLTWAEYMDPDLIEQFESRYNTKVKFIYFESDELRDDMLLSTNNAFDVICTNGRSIKAYSNRGWITPITDADVPNKKHIHTRWAHAFPYANEYAIPFFWGTLGIAYRKDLVTTPITSWQQLLKPKTDLQGKITLVKDARDLMAMALKSQGYSVNTENTDELKLAKHLLHEQKPYIKNYTYTLLSKESALVTGEAVALISYNGDAMQLIEHNNNITYVIPDEGTNIWVDYLVVSKNSTKKKLAMNFINFLNEPINAAKLAQYVYYASPNHTAEKYLPKDFLADPVIYPDETRLKKSEFYRELSPRIQKKYNTILPHITEQK